MSDITTQGTAVVNLPESSSVEVDGYRVEACTLLHGGIKEVAGKNYANHWAEVPVVPAAAYGVRGDLWSEYQHLAHCLSYAQAYALAWAFKAEADASRGGAMRVRIVRYRVKCSWSSEADGYVNELPMEARVDGSFTQVELVEP